MKNLVSIIRFTKMTGAGNDFVVVDNLDEAYAHDWNSMAPKLCDRRYGVGADGLIVLEKSDIADVRMMYFNADGSYGGMCGNGGRCVASYMMEMRGTRDISIEALDYVYKATGEPERISLAMKDPKDFRKKVHLKLALGSIYASYLNTGSPHAVTFVEWLPENFKEHITHHGIKVLGREIRHDPAFFPEGTNVSFVSIIDEQTISVRTYERGVEDETLACGTGAVACAIISSLLYGVNAPVTVIPKSGSALKVSFKSNDNDPTGVILEGPVKKVFAGEYCFVAE